MKLHSPVVTQRFQIMQLMVFAWVQQETNVHSDSYRSSTKNYWIHIDSSGALNVCDPDVWHYLLRALSALYIFTVLVVHTVGPLLQ